MPVKICRENECAVSNIDEMNGYRFYFYYPQMSILLVHTPLKPNKLNRNDKLLYRLINVKLVNFDNTNGAMTILCTNYVKITGEEKEKMLVSLRL